MVLDIFLDFVWFEVWFSFGLLEMTSVSQGLYRYLYLWGQTWFAWIKLRIAANYQNQVGSGSSSILVIAQAQLKPIADARPCLRFIFWTSSNFEKAGGINLIRLPHFKIRGIIFFIFDLNLTPNLANSISLYWNQFIKMITGERLQKTTCSIEPEANEKCVRSWIWKKYW